MNIFSLPAILLTYLVLVFGAYGFKRGKPLTSLLIFGMWFQGLVAPEIMDPIRILIQSTNPKAAWVFTLGTLLFTLSSWYVFWIFSKFRVISKPSESFAVIKKYQRLGAVLTILSWAFFLYKITLLGGIENLWTRESMEIQVKGAGILDLLTSFVILYPIILLQAYIGSEDPSEKTKRRIPRAIIFVPLLLLVFSFFLGTTTRTVLDLSALSYPILMTLRNKPIKFIVKRLVIISCIGFLCIGFLRFGRFLGDVVLLKGGSFGEAEKSINGSGLALNNSFTEYQFFSSAIEGVDAGGPQLGIDSYELAFLQFVPGFLWPGKADFISRSRPDFFFRDHYVRTLAPLPTTFLGEGYLAEGLTGVIIISSLLGLLVGLLENSLMNHSVLSLATTLGCLLTPAIFIQVRMDISSGFLFVASAIAWMWLVRIFRVSGSQSGNSEFGILK